MGKYKFGNRVCDEWNGLADDVVMVGSLVTFKAKLDHHLRNVWGLFKLYTAFALYFAILDFTRHMLYGKR